MSETSKTGDEVHVVEVRYTTNAGNDAMNLLVGIWLCGFRNGAVTGLSHPGPLPAEMASIAADHLAHVVRADRLRVEGIRVDIENHVRAADIPTAPGSPS